MTILTELSSFFESELLIFNDLLSYEHNYGIDINYQKNHLVILGADKQTAGVLSYDTCFSEIYIDDIWVDKSQRKKVMLNSMLICRYTIKMSV